MATAILENQPSTVRELLEGIADPNRTSVELGGKTALSYAVAKGLREVARILVSDPRVDVNLGSPLRDAIQSENLEIVQLLGQRADLKLNFTLREWDPKTFQDYHKGPLNWALDLGRLDIFRYLLALPGIHVNEGVPRPLDAAIERSDLEAVRALLNMLELDINRGGGLALISAIKQNKTQIALLLIQNSKTDVNVGYGSLQGPLGESISKQNVELVTAIVARPDLDINIQTYPERYTALMHAAQVGHTGIARILLSREDLNPLLQNEYGKTAYDIAIKAGHGKIASMIREKEKQWEKKMEKARKDRINS
jgi:ankyrin repeat protein